MEDLMQIMIPQNLENMQLPSPELLTYYRNLEDRVIWIDYGVDETILEVTSSTRILLSRKESQSSFFFTLMVEMDRRALVY